MCPKSFKNWLARLFGGKKSPEAEARARVFSEESGENAAWDVENPSQPRDAAEAVFAQTYADSLPDERGVDKLLSRKKAVREVLDNPRSTKMKLVVGLGNPGGKYVGTRHNVGYEILAELGRRHGTGRAKSKFQAELLEVNIAGAKVVLLSPVTYMNLSGRSVRPCVDFYKIAKEDILVLCDDVNLPVGKIRVRAKGTAGGQKGLADVIRVMGGDDVPRLRVGIGEPPASWAMADYVLSKFTAKEIEEMKISVLNAADAVELWIASGIETCMNKYNS